MQETLIVLSEESNTLLNLPVHEDQVSSVAFSRDGDIFASGSYDGTIHIMDAGTCRERLRLDNRTEPVTCLAFSPANNDMLASGSMNCVPRLWNVKTGENRLLGTLPAQEAGLVTCLSFSPDGNTLASANCGVVRFWNVGTQEGRTPRGVEARADSVLCVAFSPKEHTFACGSRDGVIQVWEMKLDSECEKFSVELKNEELCCVAFSPDGDILASVGTKGVASLWNMKGEKIDELPVGPDDLTYVGTITFFPSLGKRILAAGAWGAPVVLWDASSRRELSKVQLDEFGANCLAFSPDGTILAFASGCVVPGCVGHTVRFCNADTLEEIQTVLTYEKLSELEYRPLAHVKQVVLSLPPVAAVRADEIRAALNMLDSCSSNTVLFLLPSISSPSGSANAAVIHALVGNAFQSKFGVRIEELSWPSPSVPLSGVTPKLPHIEDYLDLSDFSHGFDLVGADAKTLPLATRGEYGPACACAVRKGSNVWAVLPRPSERPDEVFGKSIELTAIDAESLKKTAIELSRWGWQESPILVSSDTPKHEPVGQQEPSSTVLPWLEKWVRQAPAKLSPDGLSEILRLIQVVLKGGERTERKAAVKRLFSTFESWPTRSRDVEILGKETMVIIGFLNELPPQLRVMLLHDSERVQHHLLTAFLTTVRKVLRTTSDENLTFDHTLELARGAQDVLKNLPGLFNTRAGRETERAMWQLIQDSADRIAGQMRKAFDADDYENARKCAKRLMSVPGLGWICELGKSGVECPDPEAVAIYCITSLRGKKEKWLACAAYEDALQRWAEHQDGHSARERFFTLLDENGIEPSCLEERAREDASGLPEVAGQLGQKELEELPSVAAISSSESGGKTDAQEYVFKEGAGVWEVKFEGHELSLKNLLGARCIAHLLANPCKWIPADELHAIAKKERYIPEADSLGTTVDEQTREELKESAKDLQKELERARKDKDKASEKRCENDMRMLIDQIRSVTKPGGELRQIDKSRRTTATNPIRRCIAVINKKCPSLGAHLENSIKTGSQMSYRPHPSITWQVF